jgi:hypothetical protein
LIEPEMQARLLAARADALRRLTERFARIMDDG